MGMHAITLSTKGNTHIPRCPKRSSLVTLPSPHASVKHRILERIPRMTQPQQVCCKLGHPPEVASGRILARHNGSSMGEDGASYDCHDIQAVGSLHPNPVPG